MTRYPCPCCHYLTLTEPGPGTFEICPVCFWEDDDVQLDDPDYEGGANRESLNQARASFRAIGASSPAHLGAVRPPTDEEKPPDRIA